MSSASNNQSFDPTTLPARWLDCPRKSTIIAEKFIAFKTPLDDRFRERINAAQKWTCSMLVNSLKGGESKQLGLVIDLTNTDRYYSSDTEFIQKNIQYKKIRCQGHDATPNRQQITEFIRTCTDFFEQHPNEIIGVHCTHGFNRTGFLICSYLCQKLEMNIQEAIDLFAAARPTGIYKQDYLDALLKLYGNEGQNPDKQFAVNGLSGVNKVMCPSIRTAAQFTIQEMCDWNLNGFPGSQPVSMDKNNYQMIVQSPYMVSWKADGTRYMMLIEDENKIYMFDRDNTVFKIDSLPFPLDRDYTRHLKNTLVDGEFVMDNANGQKIPRYFIYDIVAFEGINVGQKPFRERLDIIRRSIVDVRNEAAQRGRFDKSRDTFSVRPKQFDDLSHVKRFLTPEFRSQIGHEMDGLIFQPELDPYVPGQSSRVLKWKQDHTIDFRLRICTQPPQIGCPRERIALLYVGGMQRPFSKMIYTPKLRQYDGKIIECTFQNNQWRFLRERTDKSFPNAFKTAQGALTAAQHPIEPAMLCSIIDRH